MNFLKDLLLPVGGGITGAALGGPLGAFAGGALGSSLGEGNTKRNMKWGAGSAAGSILGPALFAGGAAATGAASGGLGGLGGAHMMPPAVKPAVGAVSPSFFDLAKLGASAMNMGEQGTGPQGGPPQHLYVGQEQNRNPYLMGYPWS